MSIHNRVNETYRHQVLNAFNENKYLPKTPEGLLDFLFAEDSEYLVYHYKEQYDKTTFVQRFNRLWVIPCWWVVAPFKWIITGSAGVNDHTKFAKWLAKITGL